MLVEMVKSFLSTPKEPEQTDSSIVPDENIVKHLSTDSYTTTGAFFDNENVGIFGSMEKADILERQKRKIMEYRNLSKQPDVSDALEEIVNEVIFNLDGSDMLTLDIDEENDKIKDAIIKKFDKITKLMNLDYNMYGIVKNSYIDGKIILHTPYDKSSTKNGIRNIKMIEPTYFYFDGTKRVYKYYTKENNFFSTTMDATQEYSPEEIVIKDFGLYENGLNLSYLEYAVKTANQLRTLEDLLIPMRFSRSISRRIFNVDVGELPNAKSEQVMREMQNKFKYKKFYNVETGEVSNQQHITSMVEDYWFANRSGGKGTQVDVLDESGNLGELDDILYFNKKLYKSMFVPLSRISIDPDADHEYDYDSTRTSKEDVKFFMFISRIRQVYISVFKQLLKLEVISTGTLKESEWKEYEDKIEIKFTSENMFIEQMKLNNFTKKIDILGSLQEYVGKYFSYETVYKDILKMDDDEIKEELTRIQKEKTNNMFKDFYSNPEENQNW